MGTGTILEVAARRFGTASCYGLEVAPEAFQLARQRLSGNRYRLFHTRFEDFGLDRVPAGARLVSNVPFGHRFARTPTPPLIELIEGPAFGGGHVALLMSREQAGEIAAATRLRARNVLVLGQPARHRLWVADRPAKPVQYPRPARWARRQGAAPWRMVRVWLAGTDCSAVTVPSGQVTVSSSITEAAPTPKWAESSPDPR